MHKSNSAFQTVIYYQNIQVSSYLFLISIHYFLVLTSFYYVNWTRSDSKFIDRFHIGCRSKSIPCGKSVLMRFRFYSILSETTSRNFHFSSIVPMIQNHYFDIKFKEEKKFDMIEVHFLIWISEKNQFSRNISIQIYNLKNA